MAYVITDSCIKDNLCVDACPSDAIHPTQTEPAYATATQLFINPAECMDCGACASECASDAIFSAEEVPAGKADAAQKNTDFYKG